MTLRTLRSTCWLSTSCRSSAREQAARALHPGAGDMWEPEAACWRMCHPWNPSVSEYEVVAPEMPDGGCGTNHRLAQSNRTRAPAHPRPVVGHLFGGSVLLKKHSTEGPPPRIDSRNLPCCSAVLGSRRVAEEYALPTNARALASSVAATPTFLYHSREDPHVPFSHLAFYEKLLPDATSRPIEGSEHSFTEGLPALTDDIRRRGRASIDAESCQPVHGGPNGPAVFHLLLVDTRDRFLR